jgi:outer membrane protein assembly factor BamB
MIEGKSSIHKKRRSLFNFIIVLSFFASLSASVMFAAGQSDFTAYPWPMIRHDPSGQGYSASPAPHTGKLLWNYTTSGGISSTAAVANGMVFIGTTNGKFYALNMSTGKLIWNITAGNLYSSPAVADGMVFIGSDYNSSVFAFDIFSGKKLWNYTTGGSIWSSPVVSNGRVFIGSNNRGVLSLNEFNGQLVWNYTVGNSIYSSPAVVDGRVFIGAYNNKFYALNMSTGKLIWNITTGGVVSCTPAVVSSTVFISSWDGKVYAFKASTGQKVWNYTIGGQLFSSPAIANGIVFMGSYGYPNGSVYALNMSTGNKIWNYTIGATYSSPVVADGMVFIPSNVGKLYALNMFTGQLIWNYTVGTIYLSSPSVADGLVFIGSQNGKLYAFGNIYGSVKGAVTYKGTGTAVAGANITATLISAINITKSFKTVTASNGSYSLKVRVGTYNLTVSKQGYYTNFTQVTVGPDDIITANFTMRYIPATIIGTITDKNTGNPIANVTVTAGSAQNTTGGNGKYLLTILLPGTYNLTVTKSGYVTNATSVIVSPGVTYTINRALGLANGIITGVVTDKNTGAYVVGATVTTGSYQATTGADGKYTLSVPPGTYTVTISKQGYDQQTFQVTVGAGATQTNNVAFVPSAGFPLLLVVAGVGGAAAIAAVVFLMKRKPKPPPKPVEKVPKPAVLRMAADPTELLSDGRSTSAIAIELLDEEGKPIKASENIEVKLSATLGKIPSTVTIKSGESTAKATLTSSTEFGEGKVSAESKGLKGASITLTFVERKRYCMHCGTRMALDVNVCPKCGKSPPSGVDVKVCPGCGEVIPIVAKFCGNCGARQPEMEKS